MRVSEYLAWKNMRPYKLAEAARVRVNLIYELVRAETNGEKPNLLLATAQKIVNASGGSIRLEDLI